MRQVIMNHKEKEQCFNELGYIRAISNMEPKYCYDEVIELMKKAFHKGYIRAMDDNEESSSY